ncbi:sigma 54-interacting transcriptional regulator [Mucilaginibacter antarcticus]|uniref:sigma 54-interacting transcriptional regulator n=1 Tax=Mucilaginibacter antarcticus TaxID=1855725 RepID=UPI0036254D38
MQRKILIVEDESMIALDLKLILTKAGYQVCGMASSVPEALELVSAHKPELVLLDIYLKGSKTGIDLAHILTERNIAFVYLSANFDSGILDKAKATQPYGFLVKPFRQNELLITLEVAFYRHQNSLESKIRNQKAFENTVREIISDTGDQDQKFLRVISSLQQYVPFDYITITKISPAQNRKVYTTFLRIGFNEYQQIGTIEFLNIARITNEEMKVLHPDSGAVTKLEYANGIDFHRDNQSNRLRKLVAKTFDLHSGLKLPVLATDGNIYAVSFYSRKDEGYNNDHLTFLSYANQTLIPAFDNTWSSKFETSPFEEATSTGFSYVVPANVPVADKKIIGNSHQILTVQDMVSIVAPLDTSVLILGESGTGKERIAKSIHQLSSRNKQPLVIVNCASLPANLIESELFGHEKGSFTGALERRLGKFELADKGTIFLDEIGEMPQELQVKLLRVLQEQEIERIGGRLL